jgi:hypothetical protein
MNTITQHSRTPFIIKYGTNIFGHREDLDYVGSVATTGGRTSNQVDCTVENEANAKFIVLACNKHDTLVAMLRELLDVRTGDGLLDPASAVFRKAERILKEAKGDFE